MTEPDHGPTDPPEEAPEDHEVPTPPPGGEAGDAGDEPARAGSDGDEPIDPFEELETSAEDGIEVAALRAELAERTLDLQRVSAEYANYRKRVDRDRELMSQNAAYKALSPVIEVLDTLDRAREHAPLEGGFKTVADQLERAVTTAGLARFGVPGDAFDPTLHEALSHLGSDTEVSVTTVKHVAKAGYRFGDRVVRAAQVLVVDPADG